MRAHLIIASVLLTAVACVGPQPPRPPAPRAAMPVTASFAKAWNAMIDEFAANNIPIKNIDRASGFVSTDPLIISSGALNYADCGTAFGDTRIRAEHARYNVVVRGDSSAATVKATALFTYGGGSATYTRALTDCSSSGYWEKGFEERIKARAEGRPPE